MTEVSKVLIAYDGSSCSDAALQDLKRAGLPTTLDAVVITVADMILPPRDDELPDDYTPAIRIREVEQHAKARAEKAIKEAQAFAQRGAKRVKADFPEWNIRIAVRGDSPAWAVLEMADRDQSDLIVVGSHKHSVVGGRLILGSVSQRVLYEARCSVRVARCLEKERDGPVRIVVGFNGEQDSEAALNAVASRAWPEGSEARLIAADHVLSGEALGVAAETLRKAGLVTREISTDGDAGHVLVREAEEWNADAIFVGTRNIHGFQHFLHGSVSSALAAAAPCSVEVSRAMQHASLVESQEGS